MASTISQPAGICGYKEPKTFIALAIERHVAIVTTEIEALIFDIVH